MNITREELEELRVHCKNEKTCDKCHKKQLCKSTDSYLTPYEWEEEDIAEILEELWQSGEVRLKELEMFAKDLPDVTIIYKGVKLC